MKREVLKEQRNEDGSYTRQELWIHGVDIIMANKHKEKMFHIFEAEYEYHCDLEQLFN